MIAQLPFAFLLAAAAAAEHGEEESLSEVLIHHISNHDYPSLAQWGMSKGVVMMLTAAAFLIVVTGWFFRKSRVSNGAPKGVTNALEYLVLFVRDEIAIAHMGPKFGRMFTPFLLTLFFFILTCNLLGLVPGAYTATSNVNMTGALALAPLLIFIETLSTLVKPVALTIRLGANMMAGHIVILVMISFIFIFKSILVGVFLAVPLAVAMYLLEIIVALIQAYVFTLLTALFVGMVVHSSH